MFEEEEEEVTKGVIDKFAKLQKSILMYLDEEKLQENDRSSKKLFEILKELIDCDHFKEIIHLIRTIANNHHRNHNFFTRMSNILIFLKEKINQTFSNTQILDYFSGNRMILLILIENEIIKIDQSIFQWLKKPENINYFFPEINAFYAGKEVELDEYNQENYRIYEEKRKLGENEDQIAQMIRNDSLDEFIVYANQTNMNLDSKIIESNFETNLFLVDKIPTLIEYAAFYGSIQIFKYLQMNNVKLTSSLWLYTIHSNNPELIHLLEENHIKPIDTTYKECTLEAIKCHHNEIANYLFNNKTEKVFYLSNYVEYDNFERLKEDSAFFSKKFCKLQNIYDSLNERPKIVDLLIRESYINVNFTIVLTY